MSLSHNIKWLALSQGIRLILQLLNLTILTRLLDPSEYGLMAMAIVVINFSLIIRDLGMGAAIIQREELDSRAVSTVFWFNIMMGIGIAILVALLSPLISRLFNSNSLVPILLWLSLSFPIASLGTTQQALLERESKFKRVALIEISSSAIALFVAITMAYFNYGVYSLVGQLLINSVLSSFFLWLSSHWRPNIIFSYDEFKKLLSFGGNLTAFNIINFFSRNADSMIIGHNFSTYTLGAYSLSYRIMLFPLQSLTSVVSRSLYPIISRQQEDNDLVRQTYLMVLLGIASITAPMMMGIAVLRESFVNLVFGSQWYLVPTLLLWLAPTGFIQSLLSTTGTVFMSKGKTQLLMRLGIFSTLIQVGAFVIGAQYDVQHMALFYLIANIVNASVAFRFTMRLLGGSVVDILKIIYAPLVCTTIMVGALMLIKLVLMGKATLLYFAMEIVFGFFIYVLSYRFLFPYVLRRIIPERFHRVMMLF